MRPVSQSTAIIARPPRPARVITPPLALPSPWKTMLFFSGPVKLSRTPGGSFSLSAIATRTGRSCRIASLRAVASARDELIRLHRARRVHDTVLRTIEGELDLEELRLMRAADT